MIRVLISMTLHFRIESTLVSLGWSKIEDKMDESFKLKWVECKSQINYDSFRDGKYPVPACGGTASV